MSASAKKQKIVEVDVGDEVVELTAVPEPEPEVDEPELPPAVKAPPELIPLVFRGQEFKIPKLMDRWKTEACLAMSEGDYVAAAKILLGRGQWAQLLALGDEREDMREFLGVFADVVDKECVA